jgi:arylsulfatase A-like enzyme
MRGFVPAVAVALCVGCGSERDPPLRPVTRVVALRHQAPASPSMAGVPVAAVGNVYRPVLVASRPTTLLRRAVDPSATAPAELDVPIPEALRQGRLRLTARVATLGDAPMGVPIGDRLTHIVSAAGSLMELLYGPGEPVAAMRPVDVESPGPVVRVTVEVGAAPGAHRMLLVTARPEPERSYTTPAVNVPHGARLRFGIGDQEAGRRGAPTKFSLTVLRGASADGAWEHALDPAATSWVDADVDLSRWAGESVRFRFEATSAAGEQSFPLWSDPTIVAPASDPRDERPKIENVLLVSLDTLRADRLGCYGYGRPTSPAIDAELAARGVVFANAFTPFPSTAAAHMTMLTGVDPCVHRIVGGDDPPLPDGILTVAERLRAAGWETGAFTENGLIQAAKGFARGFGEFVEDRSANRQGLVDRTFELARAFVAANRGRPWLAFVHTYQVHSPYDPPAGYLERVRAAAGGGTPSDSDRYDAEVRYTDDVVAAFLRDLDRLGERDRTAIIVTSDHGEHFGEHGLAGHNNSVYRALLHVPLILAAPGLEGGRTVRATVGLADVPATILDLLGLPPAERSHGASVLPLLDGAQPVRDRWAQIGMPPRAIALHSTHKWIVDRRSRRGARYRLDDALERERGRPRPFPHVVRRFREHCNALGFRAVTDVPLGAPQGDPALRDKLRALGYLE